MRSFKYRNSSSAPKMRLRSTLFPSFIVRAIWFRLLPTFPKSPKAAANICRSIDGRGVGLVSIFFSILARIYEPRVSCAASAAAFKAACSSGEARKPTNALFFLVSVPLFFFFSPCFILLFSFLFRGQRGARPPCKRPV